MDDSFVPVAAAAAQKQKVSSQSVSQSVSQSIGQVVNGGAGSDIYVS